MADLNVLAAYNFGGVGHTLILGIYWVLGIGLFAFLFWFILREITYKKITFVVRKINDDRSLLFVDNAKPLKKNGTVVKWTLKRLKMNVPIPPNEAVEVTTKGKTFVEAYLTPDEEIVYITDKYDDLDKIGTIHPLKAIDKEFFISEVKEGEERYKKKNISEILLQIAPIMAIVIILVLFFIFFDDAVAPTIEFSKSLISASNSLNNALAQMQTCTQTITIPN